MRPPSNSIRLHLGKKLALFFIYRFCLAQHLKFAVTSSVIAVNKNYSEREKRSDFLSLDERTSVTPDPMITLLRMQSSSAHTKQMICLQDAEGW